MDDRYVLKCSRGSNTAVEQSIGFVHAFLGVLMRNGCRCFLL